MKVLTLTIFAASFCWSAALAQINYTANDTVVPYSGNFGYGTNAGYFPPHSNIQISTKANAAGCESIRGTIPHDFITTWGLTADLGYWSHNNAIGLKDNVAFIGFPHSTVEDPHLSCGGVGCPVHALPHKPGNFRGLHLPIWDGGANGTPVNELNTYAKYVYDITTTYKDYVRFWEVWNEPDFSTSPNAWAAATNANSWWNRSNFECDCPCMAGTIFDYVRMLRVSYEVIKSVDSTAYVCTGGIGWPSFLDAILRYTDNPVDGTVTAAYPNKGGAYFDVLSFHSYPQFSSTMRYWSNAQGQIVNERHSDAAADGVRAKWQELDAVLQARSYNGTVFPKKEWIITEHNISRRPFNGYVGGEDAQRNYHIKTLILQQLDGIKQSYVYGISEKETLGAASGSYDLMGLFESLSFQSLTRPLTSAGIANLTMSSILQQTSVDVPQTQLLNLPSNVRGAAFLDTAGNHIYVLWAETQTDNSEISSATYSFPASLVSGSMDKYEWNFSQTNLSTQISPLNIALSGTPVFLKEQTVLPANLVELSAARSGGKVNILWQTEREVNLDFYTIARSINGSDFEKLSELPAQNKQGLTEYRIEDSQPHSGTSWYRLSYTDMDGFTRNLNTVSVEAGAREMSLSIVKNTPQAIHLDVSLPGKQRGNLQLMAIDGKLIQQVAITGENQHQSLELNTTGLASGMYFLVLEGNGKRLSKKISH